MDTSDRLMIGELARAGGVGVETIRYYERRGLLAEPARTASGYRQYDPDAVRQVRFIKRAQRLGFTLRQIAELLDLRLDPTGACADVRASAHAKLTDIEEKLRSLRAMKKALSDLAAACDGKGRTDRCHILNSLDTDGDTPAR